MRKSIFKLIAAVTIVATLSTSCSGSKNSLSSMANLSSLMGLVGSNSNLTTLLSLVQTAGLGDMLGGTNLLTLLAPTNNAFANLDTGVLNNLLGDKNAASNLLNNHIIKGSSDVSALTNAGSVNNMLNGALNFAGSGENATVNGANITESLKTDNGYAHLIDKVLGM